MRSGTLRRTGIGATAAAVAAYAWWATDLRSFTLPSLAAVLGAGLAGMFLGAALLPPRPLPPGAPPTASAPPAPPRGLPVWAGLGAALGLWQLASFLQHPRARHPTLSSLADTLLRTHPVRALGLVAWLAASAALARR